MMGIPLVDLRAQYRQVKPEIDRAIQAVLDRGVFVLGPEVEALERELAAYCGTAQAVAVASGTDALELSLRAVGVGPGDEVITTAFSFFATAEAILAAGARPVFVDIDPHTYTLDPDGLTSAFSRRTKAVIPVHLYGHPCEMAPIQSFARSRGIAVIEDCAQAIGAQDQGRRVGAIGDAGCLSFYPTKNLGGYGEGGMVVTNDAGLAEQVRLLRVHGSRERYHHVAVGRNSRLDELQAAILRVKLRHLDQWNAARRSHAGAYGEAFRRHRLEDLVLPTERPGCTHVYHLYAIRTKERERIAQTLEDQEIATQVAYPSTVPSQPALAALGGRAASCPTAELVAREILALPMYPELTPAEIERVVEHTAHALSQPARSQDPTCRVHY